VAALPHERSLVERLKDEPFALIGVHTEAELDLATAKERCAQERVTWRNFHEGTPPGATGRRWNIWGWPTLYLVDAQGIIRKRWIGNPGAEVLDAEIDKLVLEAK
jgi:hypothetical protein